MRSPHRARADAPVERDPRAPAAAGPLATARAALAAAAVALAAGAGPLDAQAAASGGDAAAEVRPSRADAALAARVDSVFARYDRSDGPGCSVGASRHGRLVLARGYGMANLDLGVALSPRSVFRIASTSKQFTAAAALLLERDGLISLDDPVRKHFPEFRPWADSVTVRDLLHHTSGIRDYLELFALAGYRDSDSYRPGQAMEMLARQERANFPPRERHLYSNSGYFLVSQLVPRVTGRSLREFAEERIFGPLGMTQTHFHDDHREVVPNRATGYAATDDGGFRISTTTLDMVGDGGVFTTVEDFLLWNRNFDNPVVGGPGFAEAMARRGRLASGERIDYAMGLVHTEVGGLPALGHGGSFVGYRTGSIRFPEQGFAAVVLCNVAGADPDSLKRAVARIFLEREMARAEAAPAESADGPAGDDAEERDPAEDADPQEGAAQEEAGEGPRGEPAGPLSDYAGAYYSDELAVDYVVRARRDSLTVRRGRHPPEALEPAGGDEFRFDGNALRFRRDGDGRVTGLVLDGGRVRGIRFERVGPPDGR